MRAKPGILLSLFMSGWAAVACASEPNADSASLADAHVHLSGGSTSDLERLVDAGVVAVRDCGGDLPQLKQWRDEILAVGFHNSRQPVSVLIARIFGRDDLNALLGIEHHSIADLRRE